VEGNLFVKACLDFLNDKLLAQRMRQENNSIPAGVPLSMDVVAIFIRILRSMYALRCYF
jgi:CCR4-NOT transcription complex subunit 1